MSGFVMVVLVLFAVSTTMHIFNPPPTPASAPPDPLRIQREARDRFLDSIQSRLEPFSRTGVVRFDRRNHTVNFNSDASFATGSACLTSVAASAIDRVIPEIQSQLEKDRTLTIHVEGHTDQRTVIGVTNRCGWFADNTQLSTLRAANVRARIAAHVPFETLARLPVTGWGADRPIDRNNPASAENRRVELAFTWPARNEDTDASAR